MKTSVWRETLNASLYAETVMKSPVTGETGRDNGDATRDRRKTAEGR